MSKPNSPVKKVLNVKFLYFRSRFRPIDKSGLGSPMMHWSASFTTPLPSISRYLILPTPLPCWSALLATSSAFWKMPSADRKSTRLNSSHQIISYAVFCLKKKKKLSREGESSRQQPPHVSIACSPEPP